MALGRPKTPPAKVSLEHRFIIGGNRGWYKKSGVQLDYDTSQVMHKEYTASWDGKDSYSMFSAKKFEGHPPGVC